MERFFWNTGRLPANEGNKQGPCRLLFDRFWTSIIARRGGRAGVPHQFLGRAEIDAVIEQIPDKGAPEVMGSQLEQLRLLRAREHNGIDALGGQPRESGAGGLRR